MYETEEVNALLNFDNQVKTPGVVPRADNTAIHTIAPQQGYGSQAFHRIQQIHDTLEDVQGGKNKCCGICSCSIFCLSSFLFHLPLK